MTKKISDEDFIELWNQHKSVATVSKITGIAYRAVLKRRKSIEERHDIMLLSNDNRGRPNIYIPDDQTQCNINLDNGVIIVGSDCHYNPRYITTAHRAFVQCVKHLKPKVVILNGDLSDFASISQHHRIGWQHHPTIKEELDEMTTTGNVAGYNIPMAFQGNNPKNKARKKGIATQRGMQLTPRGEKDLNRPADKMENLAEAKVRYHEYKKDESATPHKKIANAIFLCGIS